MKRIILICLALAVAAGAQAQYAPGTIYRTSDKIVFQSGTTLQLNEGSTFTNAESSVFTLGADEYFKIDASTTAQTQTAGAFDLNFATLTTNTSALNIAATINDGMTAGEDAWAQIITLTANDANGDLFGLKIAAAATTNAAAGSYEYLIGLDCAENTSLACTDGILIESSGFSGGLVDAIDVSATNITNGLNLGQNILLGGRSDFLTIGDTDNTLTFTVDSTNTATLLFADASGAANGLIDTSGAGAITIGSADVTTVDIVTDGGTVSIDGAGITPAGITSDPAAGTWTFTKTSAGGASIIGADDAGAATLTLDVAGAGSITVGSADVTAVTITTDSTADGSDLVLPENAVSGNEAMIPADSFMACGELAENGTTFLGPALAPFGGDATASYALASAGCDALDNVTEGTADAPLTGYGAFKVVGMWCRTDGTLGAAETIVYTLRTAAGATTPSITCTISTGEQYCRSVQATTTDIAAGATVAVSAAETSDNADDNGWCRVYIQPQ